jgi:tetratricopeptide (TPR) repeat protein
MDQNVIDLSISPKHNGLDHLSFAETIKEKVITLELKINASEDSISKLLANPDAIQGSDIIKQILELQQSFIGIADSASTIKLSAATIAELPSTIRISSSSLPDPNFHYILGSYFLRNGQAHAAIWAFEQAIALNPDFVKAKMNLGNAKLHIALVDEAISIYKEVVATGQELRGTYNNLGVALCRRFKYTEAREVFHKNLLAGHGISNEMQRKYTKKYSKRISQNPDSIVCTPFKSKAMYEQLLFLLTEKRIHSSYYELAQQYNQLYEETRNVISTQLSTNITLAQLKPFNGYYDKLIHYTECPRVKGNALNSSVNYSQVEEEYIKHQVIYYDDFLTSEALSRLRGYFRYSTVFFPASNAGFVGSYLNDGFDCDLIYQIVEELHAKFANLLRNKPLTKMWCYKYDKQGSGVRPHSDGGSVTFNFSLTENEANLMPGSGGLIIYDKEHPDYWDRHKTNAYKNDPSVQDQIQQYLSNAKRIKVPYGCNRVIVFKSSLFHQTDPYSFRDDFGSRRMNITMLFGKPDNESAGME